ncbi:type II toxin-antitoxin system RelE/ParE family toxin [Sutcliffiella cohnii]|uniref:type II toxin-antitoxin system RelE/ParE family toxin n=1 Tax=Sutcliffiella cohnii TaxID=33932 RepID=UPI002E233367|nr:type II toxin-antitoxin system RelE/ParE family toxin [Sutcliffiella cohnii]
MDENKFQIKVTPIAYSDLDEIYSYIVNSLFNESAADLLIDKIETSIMRLRDFPYSCSLVSDEVLKVKGYRKLIVENYIVFYIVRVDEREVIVMRVLYGGQKYQDLL